MLLFPVDISYGSTSNNEFNTTVIATKNGYEQRNQNWSTDRRSYNVVEGARRSNKLETLRYFHKLVRGRLSTFLYKDWFDYKSSESMNDAISNSDQVIGTGNGTKTQFQLIKTYDAVDASSPLTINITRPVTNTELISLNNVSNNSYIIDYDTGIITFNTAPGTGVVVRAGYEYNIPCRFDNDKLVITLDTYNISSSSVDIVEVRE